MYFLRVGTVLLEKLRKSFKKLTKHYRITTEITVDSKVTVMNVISVMRYTLFIFTIG